MRARGEVPSATGSRDGGDAPHGRPPTQFAQVRNRLLLPLILAVATLVGLLAYGDFTGIGDSLASFTWVYLPAILSLTLFNYALRFAKWQFYLRVTGVEGVRWRDSLLIFLAGLAMTLTPAKVGEWIKSHFLRERYGVPVSRTAPIVLAERLTDGYAMILLAGAGLILVDRGWIFLVFCAVLGAMALVALRYRPVANWVMGMAKRVPFLRRRRRFIAGFYRSAFLLFSPKALAVAVAIGFMSWMGEGIAMYYVLRGLGAANSFELAVEGVFILAITSLAGALLLVPGGLGVSEGGIAGLTKALTELSREAAATATLLIRICTLWFGVALGLVALLALSRQTMRYDVKKAAPVAPAS